MAAVVVNVVVVVATLRQTTEQRFLSDAAGWAWALKWVVQSPLMEPPLTVCSVQYLGTQLQLPGFGGADALALVGDRSGAGTSTNGPPPLLNINVRVWLSSPSSQGIEEPVLLCVAWAKSQGDFAWPNQPDRGVYDLHSHNLGCFLSSSRS